MPYPGMTNNDVAKEVLAGYRMNVPDKTPEEVGALMKQCWNKDPEQRPTFDKIYARLEPVRSKSYRDLKAQRGSVVKSRDSIGPVTNEKQPGSLYAVSD